MINKLQEIGFTKREAEAYIALIESGESNASQIAKRTSEHRTNIYDSLNNLIKIGIVSYAIKNNIKFFKANNPETLIDHIKEKEKLAEELILIIKQKQILDSDKPITEIYEGEEGFKTILGIMLREEKTIYGIGASEEWEKRFPIKLNQYMMEREKRKIKAKLLYIQGTQTIKHKLNEIKFLPKQQFQPATIAIVGDKVITFMWTEPLTATLTKSKELAKSYENYFEVLWKTAKKS